jgi:hypothetical protein
MKTFRRVALAAALNFLPAVAESAPPCGDQVAAASMHYRNALYQSDPLHRDEAAAKTAVQAFLAIWNDLIGRGKDCRQDPDEEAILRIRGIADIAAKAAAETAAGRPDQAHLTLLQIRPMLGDLRHAGEHEDYTDHLDAFDDKLSETADDDLDDDEISADQFVQLCEQVGVLGYLSEKLEKRAPPQWGADPTFLDALENLSRQIRGLRITILRGQRSPIRAALSDLRRSFDLFYLLYG